MENSIEKVSLVATTVVLGVIFLAGVRERIVNMPKWFANPPASFELIRQQSKNATKFWIPVQIIFLVALITAFVTNWKYINIRTLMWIGTIFFVLVIVLTASYYVKEIMAFQKMPVDAPATPELLKRAHKWYSTTIVRNILQGVALGFMVAATYKKLMP